jgi:hypothetical protein
MKSTAIKMSKMLIKIVDESIVPSLALVFSKIGGIMIGIIIFDLDFEIVKTINSNVFPYELRFNSFNGLISVNTLSNILMLIVPLIGFYISIYKMNNFQDSRLTPSKIIKIADKDRLSSIEKSEDVYIKAIVWLCYSWLAIILTTISVLKVESHVWTAVLSVIFGIISTLILVKNLEIDYTKNK